MTDETKKELAQYLKENLKVEIYDGYENFGGAVEEKLIVRLFLEGEIISESYTYVN